MFLLISYYIINPNGMINSTYTNTTGYGQLTANVSSGIGGLMGWAFGLIPFFVVLAYALRETEDIGISTMAAGLVAAGAAVIGTGIGSPPLVANPELYLFIAVFIIGGVVALLKGVTSPY